MEVRGKMQNCKRIISFYGYCFYTHIQLIHQETMSIFGDENLAKHNEAHISSTLLLDDYA